MILNKPEENTCGQFGTNIQLAILERNCRQTCVVNGELKPLIYVEVFTANWQQLQVYYFY